MTPTIDPTEPATGLHTSVQPEPEWVENSTDPCYYHSDGGSGDGDFWYSSVADCRNGLSYSGDPGSMGSPEFQNKCYRMPLYGGMRTTVIDGKAWCSLDDVGRIAGVPITQITGCFPFSSVRGQPGYLVPDGIRHLGIQDIDDEGIRLEAIIPTLMKARDGQKFTKCLLDEVIPDVYADFPAMADEARKLVASTEALIPDLLKSPARSTRMDEVRSYHDCHGEFRAVCIGTRFWLRVDDVACHLSVPVETILRLLDNDRVINVGKMGDHDWSHAPGLQTQYMEFRIFRRLMRLSHYGTSVMDWLSPLVDQFIENAAAHASISAGVLHRMLGHHQEFDAWAWDVNRKNGNALSWVDPDQHSKLHRDLQVPIKLAMKLAFKDQTFAGAITYCLLADGGYLHGGPWNESPEDCLKRFHKLIPDRQGRVDRRKVKEFMEPRGSTSNRSGSDEVSGTRLMTMEDAWNLFTNTFGTTTNSLKKFGVRRKTKS